MIIGAPGTDSDAGLICYFFPPSSAFEGTSIESALYVCPSDIYLQYAPKTIYLHAYEVNLVVKATHYNVQYMHNLPQINCKSDVKWILC